MGMEVDPQPADLMELEEFLTLAIPAHPPEQRFHTS